MNKKIGDVITEYIKPAKIVIEGKTEIGKRPLPAFNINNPVQAPFNILPGKIRDLNGGIRNDIVIIVKMPRAVKAVGID